MTLERTKATTIEEVMVNADVLALPEGDKDAFYVSLDTLRGEPFIRPLIRDIGAKVKAGRCAAIAFAGQRGCGKTTELNRLRRLLADEGYYVVYRDVAPEPADTPTTSLKSDDGEQLPYPDLKHPDVDFPEVLLFILFSIIEDAAKRDIDIGWAFLRPILEWFAETTIVDRDTQREELELLGGLEGGYSLFGVLKFLVKLQGSIKTGEERSRERKRRLKENRDELIQKVNWVISALREKLPTSQKEIVLILDSFDKHTSQAVESLLIDNARLFTRLNVHLIMTVPLAVLYIPKKESLPSAGYHVYNLPTPAVRRREQPIDECQLEECKPFLDILAARVDLNAVFTDPTIPQEMIKLSGGSLRDLFWILYESAKFAEDDKIDQAALKMGVKSVVNTFTSPLRHDKFEFLKQLHTSPSQSFDPSEDGYWLLFYRYILRYNHVVWADIHPLLMEFRPFKEYLGQ